MQSVIAFIMSIILFLTPAVHYPQQELDKSDWTTDYSYIFVHGLIGWGEDSFMDKIVSYFGTFGGSLMPYLRSVGIDCHAATVRPEGSAWDRACELYAQLTGTRTDYGEAHSRHCLHTRYGADYTGRPLIDAFDAEHKINLIGHSFGGATILQFLELLANGDETERETSGENVSPLFEGGKADWVYSLTTLASPTNGTTLYELANPETVSTQRFNSRPAQFLLDLTSVITVKKSRLFTDTAVYDMQVDRAIELADSCETIGSVYYFSVPCTHAQPNEKGNYVPKSDMVFILKPFSRALGAFQGVTAGGVEIDERWKENDGLVNTISERAPFHAPQKDIDMDNIEPGVWNVFPTLNADHMFFSGGFFRTTDIRSYFVDYVQFINTLPSAQQEMQDAA